MNTLLTAHVTPDLQHLIQSHLVTKAQHLALSMRHILPSDTQDILCSRIKPLMGLFFVDSIDKHTLAAPSISMKLSPDLAHIIKRYFSYWPIVNMQGTLRVLFNGSATLAHESNCFKDIAQCSRQWFLDRIRHEIIAQQITSF